MCLVETHGLCHWVVVDLRVVYGVTQGPSAVRRSMWICINLIFKRLCSSVCSYMYKAESMPGSCHQCIDAIRHSKINGSGMGEFFCFHSTWTGMTGTATGHIASHCSFLMQADHMIFVARLQCRLFVGDKESIHCYWFGPHSKNADLWVSWYKGPNRMPKWSTYCL